MQFEVRSDVENESLGCNHKVACSIVVIPINGISSAATSRPSPGSSGRPARQRRDPDGVPATRRASRSTRRGHRAATSPTRASTRRSRRRCGGRPPTGRNRFSIPITFGLPPDTCDVLDPRPPTGFYGSELMAQASLQWSPAYCLNKKRFKFQLNQMSDAAGLEPDGERRRRGGVRLLAAPRHAATTRSATPRPRSPASRSATTSTSRTTRASTPTSG